MRENVLLGPAGNVEHRARRQKVEAGECKIGPVLTLEPLIELVLKGMEITNVACRIFALRIGKLSGSQSLVCCCLERSWPRSSFTRSLSPWRSV